jgi:hypothetical protein
MRLVPLILILLCACVAASAFADDEQSRQTAPPVSSPDINDQLQQPQIIVRPSPSGEVEEYRVGGQLYMIKVTPEKGVSYYLVDTDGDGSLETRRNELSEQFAIPQWTLKRWR